LGQQTRQIIGLASNALIPFIGSTTLMLFGNSFARRIVLVEPARHSSGCCCKLISYHPMCGLWGQLSACVIFEHFFRITEKNDAHCLLLQAGPNLHNRWRPAI
jgi:hypothetical protein